MDIQNLVIANHHINLIRALKDYHIRHYIWEISKVMIPVLITGTITVVVMRGNENRNKKRWLNESFVKHQNDLILKINKILPEFLNKFDSHFNIFENTPVKMSLVYNFFNNYGTELKELNSSYYELLELYRIEIKPLAKVLFQLNYLKNYVGENPDETILVLQDGTKINIDDCIQDIIDDLIKSKNEMIKVIQKKLK